MENRYSIQTEMDGRHALYLGGKIEAHFYDLKTAKIVAAYLNIHFAVDAYKKNAA